jgi:hypothetical protein
MGDIVCFRCGRELEWAIGWGIWIHKGGGALMQFCPDCKREFTLERPVDTCPYCCVKGNLRDTHQAYPRREK